jgi:hypothetical protein
MPFPPNFTDVWDTTTPADTQLVNQGALDFRNLKLDIMQRMSLLSGTLANRPQPETVNAVWGGSGFGLIYLATDTQTFYQWNGAIWNAIPMIPSGSQVVAKTDLLSQSGSVGATTIYNVPSSGAGLYRLIIQVVITVIGGGGSSVQARASWKNEAGQQFTNFPVGGSVDGSATPGYLEETSTPVGSNGNNQNSQIMMSSAASQPIQYSINLAGNCQYNAHIRLEFLT